MTFGVLRKRQAVYTILLVHAYSKEISKPSKFKQGLSCAPGSNLATKAKPARKRKLHTYVFHPSRTNMLKCHLFSNLAPRRFFGTDTHFNEQLHGKLEVKNCKTLSLSTHKDGSTKHPEPLSAI